MEHCNVTLTYIKLKRDLYKYIHKYMHVWVLKSNLKVIKNITKIVAREESKA